MAFPEQAFEHGDMAAGVTIDQSALGENDDPTAQSYYLEQVAEFFGRVGNERHPECPDGLALADSELLVPIQEVNRRYQQACEDPSFNGSIDAWWALWKTCFRVPEYIRNPLQVADKNGRSLKQYLDDTWTDLTYLPKETSTRIGANNPHLRASTGGRYNVGYYWDTEVALRGLAVDVLKNPELLPLMRGVVQNIADIIERFGYVPNGMRNYYSGPPIQGASGRSQPASFVSMVEQLDYVEQYLFSRDTNVVEDFLPQVVQEYEWWMRGEQSLEGEVGRKAVEHVVCVDGFYPTRHFDPSREPRWESRQEDLNLARLASNRDPGDVFQNMRAGAEQGTDYFPTIQCEDPTRLETIDVLSRIPMYNTIRLAETERFIARAYEHSGRSVKAAEFRHRLTQRLEFIDTYMRDSQTGLLHDYNWVKGERIPHTSIAMALAVSKGFTDRDTTRSIAETLKNDYLLRGGFATSLLQVEKPEQWARGINAANGWPSQQLDAVEALLAAGRMLGEREYIRVAHQAMTRWLRYNRAIFKEYGTIPENIDVASKQPGPGYSGEYPTQGDFGWGRAVVILFAQYLQNYNEARRINRSRQKRLHLV